MPRQQQWGQLAGERVIVGHSPTTRNVPNLVRNFALAARVIREERPDVIVVIVSEETGMVSIAENGTLHRGLTPAVLRKELKSRFTIPADRSPAAIWRLVKANS